MSEPGGKTLVCVAAEVDTWVQEETWDSLPGAGEAGPAERQCD